MEKEKIEKWLKSLPPSIRTAIESGIASIPIIAAFAPEALPIYLGALASAIASVELAGRREEIMKKLKEII